LFGRAAPMPVKGVERFDDERALSFDRGEPCNVGQL
jgi:hypothetical protein